MRFWIIVFVIVAIHAPERFATSAQAQSSDPGGTGQAANKGSGDKLSPQTKAQVEAYKRARNSFLTFYRARDYKAAEPQIKKALAIARRLLGADDLRTATRSADLAALYTSTRRYKEAMPHYREALRVRKLKSLPGAKLVISTLRDLHRVHLLMGDGKGERLVLDELLAQAEKNPKAEKETKAYALNRLSVLDINQKQYKRARGRAAKALALYDGLYGREHKSAALALSNLAVGYVLDGQLDEGLARFKEVLAIRVKQLGDSHAQTTGTMLEIANIYAQKKRYDAALAMAEQVVPLMQKRLGPEHPKLAGEWNRLAAYAYRQKKYDRAAQALGRAMAIAQKANGGDSPRLLVYLRNRATLLEDMGRYEEAEPLYRQRVKLLRIRHGDKDIKVSRAIHHLAKLNRQLARYSEAERLLKAAMQLEDERKTRQHDTISNLHNSFGGLYRVMGRYSEAGRHYQKALALQQGMDKPNPQNTARMFDNIGVLYIEMNRLDLAIENHKKALALLEGAVGPRHKSVATTLNNLAAAFGYQGRYKEARPLYERALAIRLKAARPADTLIGVLHDNLAGTYRQLDRLDEAETHYKKAVAALQLAYGLEHPEVARVTSNLAFLYEARGDHVEMEKLLQKALDLTVRAFGSDHPAVGGQHALLGDMHKDLKRYERADESYGKALKIAEKFYGPDHIKAGHVVAKLAALHLWTGQYDSALTLYRRARKIDEKYVALLSKASRGGDVEENRALYRRYAFAVWHNGKRAATGNASKAVREQLMDEGLQAAQKALGTAAGAALAQMSARFAAGDGKLSQSVRRKQDLASYYEKTDKDLLQLVGAPKERRNDKAIAALRRRLDETGAEIKRLNTQLAEKFPDYAALANPRPLTSTEIQQQLHDDEALLFFMTSNAAVYIWAITGETMIWQRAPLDRKALRGKVAKLRTALNPASLSATRGLAASAPAGPVETSFDLATSHELYQSLLAPLEDLIRDKKHLLVIAADALSGLPFQVLVTQKPSASAASERAAYQQAHWLIHRHAVTTLPSIASLKALRRVAKGARRAEKKLIGFGDPVFDPGAPAGKPVMLAASETKGVSSYFRGGKVNLAALSALAPLPDTRSELNDIAATLKLPSNALHLGRAANEQAVKALNRAGELARHQIVYFATHGLISGEVRGLAEPALALSPPKKASAENDGLLLASEVAQLRLNADWVVLSACNTASGGEPGAESLSGLARAFFYAGAKSLLVSHWPVASDAATLLTTRSFAMIDKGRRSGTPVGRSEALRRAMLSLIEDAGRANSDFAAHPSYWAPFVVVGEGAARH